VFSLVGNGSHGSDILGIAKRRGYTPNAIFDDDPERGETPPDDLSGYTIFGVYYPWQRREMAERFAKATPAPPLTDVSAIVGMDCKIGGGSVICHQTVLGSLVNLGTHVHVGYCVGAVRTNVGDYTTIAPGVTICGDVEIGEACLIGAGSVIADRVTIGDDVIIGAGAVVPPTSIVPSGSKVLGVWKP
jgi:hypothetical protein